MFKHIFFKFLDISGIIMGVGLAALGWWILSGRSLGGGVGWIVFLVGVGAFLIHVGHYFDLRYLRWIFGEDYFITKKK